MHPSTTSTATDSVFLDANILLEIILAREKDLAARKVIEKNANDLCISALTAHLMVHFGQARVELPILRQFLTDYTILPLEAGDFEWAFVNTRNQDFEDALQLSIAIRHGCSQFITFDKTLYETYKNLPTIKLQLAG
jgi:predicted nucleic acid-binding protein